MIVLWIALAGGAGAAARSAVDVFLGNRASKSLPWATLVVNISGSFALGLLVGQAVQHDLLQIVGTGFLGGYTTFSSASLYAAQQALDHRHVDAAMGTALAMVVCCVAAATLGVAVG